MNRLEDPRPTLEAAESPSPLIDEPRRSPVFDDRRRASQLPLPLDQSPKLPTAKIAVVIPAYRVRAHVLKVLEAIGPEVERQDRR